MLFASAKNLFALLQGVAVGPVCAAPTVGHICHDPIRLLYHVLIPINNRKAERFVLDCRIEDFVVPAFRIAQVVALIGIGQVRGNKDKFDLWMGFPVFAATTQGKAVEFAVAAQIHLCRTVPDMGFRKGQQFPFALFGCAELCVPAKCDNHAICPPLCRCAFILYHVFFHKSTTCRYTFLYFSLLLSKMSM